MNKQLLQQTLDALLEYDYAKTDKADRLGSAAIAALRVAIAQPEQGKLLQIIAAMYQIAGTYDAPEHVLDVLANPEGATQEQIDSLLPFNIAQPEQTAGDAIIAGALFDFMGMLTSQDEKTRFSSTDDAGPAVEQIEKFAAKRGLSLENADVKGWRNRLAATNVKPAQTYTGDDLAMAYKDGYVAGGVAMAPEGDAKDAQRYQFAIAQTDNAETLYAFVLNNYPDTDKINAEFDAEIAAITAQKATQ